ncbi:hypothetical protein BC941DRAFT_129479 [Chlamydoabsidia padenii]|nr:hypothetical protein BC941DRAFT_129479 [Chlamydoabsidia padenii]
MAKHRTILYVNEEKKKKTQNRKFHHLLLSLSLLFFSFLFFYTFYLFFLNINISTLFINHEFYYHNSADLIIVGVSAQSVIISVTAPLQGASYKAGYKAIISWINPSVDSISQIILAKGPSNALQSVSNIATNVPASSNSYTWNIPNDIPAGTDYAFEFGTSPNLAFTGQFLITGGGAGNPPPSSPSSSGSSASSGSSSSSSTSTNSSIPLSGSGSNTTALTSSSSTAISLTVGSVTFVGAAALAALANLF